MQPLRIDADGTCVFTTDQVDDYGDPCLYGFEKFVVIESRNLNTTLDYNFSVSRDWRPIHRYNRLARFKFTLLNLIGERTNIPQHVLILVKTFLNSQSKNIWNETRKILKHYKQQKYYNQIPAILTQIGFKRLFQQLTASKIYDIENDFKALVQRFNEIKKIHKRVYFPNLRFIVFKLLELHSIFPQYEIPFIRTKRKSKVLLDLWNKMIQ